MKYYGIDASELDITLANNIKMLFNLNNISFETGNIEKLPYQDSLFDMVICSEVLEHMERSEDFLLEIKRVLKDDGIVIISTPNLDNPIVRLSRFINGPHKSTDKDIHIEKNMVIMMTANMTNILTRGELSHGNRLSCQQVFWLRLLKGTVCCMEVTNITGIVFFLP